MRQARDMHVRPLGPDDALAMLELRLRNRRHFLTGEPAREPEFFTLDRQRATLAAAETERRIGTRVLLGVFDDDDTLAGYVALSQIFRGAFQNAYLGYAIDRERTGRGLATAAVAAALEHAWKLDLHRVQANVVPDNAASRRVLEKNGFRYEGLALRYLHIGGRWADHAMYAITAEERG
jgi:[ribosomal protein S5]-alanine N-acetyltransferase